MKDEMLFHDDYETFAEKFLGIDYDDYLELLNGLNVDDEELKIKYSMSV